MAKQPFALRLSNSRRRLLALARNYAEYVANHNRGASNHSLIDEAAERLEAHAQEHGKLMSIADARCPDYAGEDIKK